MAAEVAGRRRHPLAGWLSAVVPLRSDSRCQNRRDFDLCCKRLRLSCRGLLLLARRAAFAMPWLTAKPPPGSRRLNCAKRGPWRRPRARMHRFRGPLG